jgi:hypothetical protein
MQNPQPPRTPRASKSPVADAGTDAVCSKTALFGPSHAPTHRNAHGRALFTYRSPVATAAGGRREGFCKSLP